MVLEVINLKKIFYNRAAQASQAQKVIPQSWSELGAG